VQQTRLDREPEQGGRATEEGGEGNPGDAEPPGAIGQVPRWQREADERQCLRQADEPQ
jgi:hypothetical protein